MQIISSLTQEGCLPLSIVRIEVEKLFGKYTYTLSKQDNNFRESSLLILYGDNGSGKTTILKILFHLLSSAKVKNNLSFLAKTPFQKFSVFLADGTSITASRRNGELLDSFELKIHSNNEVFQENMNFENGKIVDSQKFDLFYSHLLNLQISLYFIGDDRNLDSDIIISENIYKYSRYEIISFITPSYTEDKHTINRGNSLSKSIQRTESWMREQALKGANQGVENAHSIYEEIISGIILSSGSVVQNKSANLSYDTLIAELESYETKSQDFSRFGLVSPLSTKKIVDILKSKSEANDLIISSILTPYVDSLAARFDALQDTYNILTTFEETINKVFFTDKYIKLHVRDGLKIFTDQGKELSPDILSSGEKQLLLIFCNTLTARDKATIFIIDEPEISLNIKWQRQLIRALLELTKGSQVQFILATHSIELLSQYKNHVVKLQAMG